MHQCTFPIRPLSRNPSVPPRSGPAAPGSPLNPNTSPPRSQRVANFPHFEGASGSKSSGAHLANFRLRISDCRFENRKSPIDNRQSGNTGSSFAWFAPEGGVTRIGDTGKRSRGAGGKAVSIADFKWEGNPQSQMGSGRGRAEGSPSRLGEGATRGRHRFSGAPFPRFAPFLSLSFALVTSSPASRRSTGSSAAPAGVPARAGPSAPPGSGSAPGPPPASPPWSGCRSGR